MRVRLALLSLCVLALAGCQTLGGSPQPSTPATPAGTQPSAATHTGAATPSPWAAARARGMAFRAIGSQPDWSVEVSKSHTPTLYINLDESGRHLQVSNATISSDQSSGMVAFSGRTEDGTPVELTIHRGQCQANMSGRKAASAVELDVGSSQYKGCGRFLIQQPE